MDAENFPAWPDELRQYITHWHTVAGDALRVDSLDTAGGEPIVAVTLGGMPSATAKPGVYIAQPHAHEPATIAGMVQVIHELITGMDLGGSSTTLDREHILGSLNITFNPIGNPWGRAQTDVRCWDGSLMSNRDFLLTAFGRDPADPAGMWPRLNEWRLPTDGPGRGPEPPGFVYEYLRDGWFVEPNRSKRSSYHRLFLHMDAQYDYHYWLDLHQTEFEGRPIDCELWQSNRDALEPEQLAVSQAWASNLVAHWHQQGLRAGSDIRPSATSEPMRTYFRDVWLPIQRRIHFLTAEVRNNSAQLPGLAQRDAVSGAIRQSLNFICDRHAHSNS